MLRAVSILITAHGSIHPRPHHQYVVRKINSEWRWSDDEDFAPFQMLAKQKDKSRKPVEANLSDKRRS